MLIKETKPLGQLLRRAPRYGINAAAVPLAPGTPTYLRITDIDDSGRFAPNPKVGVAHPNASSYRIKPGELVFARTGASVGKSYLYDPQDGELIYAGFLINVAPDPALLNPKFLSLVVQTKNYWDWIARTSVRSGQPGVNGREFASLPVPVVHISTQDSIAEAMSDVDEMIKKLERLIAKKQAIKHGMMQQLMTGKVRLSGFAEGWRTVRLGSAGVCLRGVSYDPNSDLSKSDNASTVRLLRSNNIQEGRLDEKSLQFVHKRRVSEAQIIRDNDILICMANGSKDLVGKSTLLQFKDKLHPYTFGAFMAIFRTNSKIADPRFIANLLQTKSFRDMLDIALAGSSINNLRPRDIEAFKSQLPPIREQRAIADVLGDVETEIEQLHTRLEKAKNMKQGMLQELLTGRTQLQSAAALA